VVDFFLREGYLDWEIIVYAVASNNIFVLAFIAEFNMTSHCKVLIRIAGTGNSFYSFQSS